MAERINITSPVGRIVAGSMYKPNTTDFDGKPLVYKTGNDAGKPRVQYFFALAIPKGGEGHWANTEWGKAIWETGHRAFPQAAQRPDFAWKIEDGDSMVPNKRNRKPAENEGWRGNWVVKFSSSFAPSLYREQGSTWVQWLDVEAVMPGDLVQVSFSVDGNGNQSNPGLYLNPSLIGFRAYSNLGRIAFGPNVEEAGFGSAPLPQGASMTPPAAPSLPAAPGVQQPPPAPPAMQQQAPPPVPVYPNPGFVQMPPNPSSAGSVASPSVPGNIPPPPPPSVTQTIASHSRAMTAAAGGVTYEAYRAAGWSDAQLIANGLMTP